METLESLSKQPLGSRSPSASFQTPSADLRSLIPPKNSFHSSGNDNPLKSATFAQELTASTFSDSFSNKNLLKLSSDFPLKLDRRRAPFASGREFQASIGEKGTVVGSGNCRLYDFHLWSNITSLAAGYQHAVGLRENGSVIAKGDNSRDQCNVSSWNNIVSITAGALHTVGLTVDRSVVATGANKMGQCSVAHWSNIVSVVASDLATFGLRAYGTVVSAGANDAGIREISHWNNITAISAGSVHVVGLRADGTVVAAGNNEFDQCNVASWKNIVAIATGNFFTVGLQKDGTLVVAGKSDLLRNALSSRKNISEIYANGFFLMGSGSEGRFIAATLSKEEIPAHISAFSTTTTTNGNIPGTSGSLPQVPSPIQDGKKPSFFSIFR